jgi:hypothetical protein
MLQLISLPQLLKPDCDSVLLQERIEKLNTAVSKFTLQISFLFTLLPCWPGLVRFNFLVFFLFFRSFQDGIGFHHLYLDKVLNWCTKSVNKQDFNLENNGEKRDKNWFYEPVNLEGFKLV